MVSGVWLKEDNFGDINMNASRDPSTNRLNLFSAESNQSTFGNINYNYEQDHQALVDSGFTYVDDHDGRLSPPTQTVRSNSELSNIVVYHPNVSAFARFNNSNNNGNSNNNNSNNNNDSGSNKNNKHNLSNNNTEIEYKDLKFENRIGKGAFGTVFKAIWINDTVAVKCVDSQKEQTTRMKKSLFSEIVAATKIGYHPNLVKVSAIESFVFFLSRLPTTEKHTDITYN